MRTCSTCSIAPVCARSDTMCMFTDASAQDPSAMPRSKRWRRAARVASCSARRDCMRTSTRRRRDARLRRRPARSAGGAAAATVRRRAAVALRQGDGDTTAPCSTSHAMAMACCATCRCAKQAATGRCHRCRCGWPRVASAGALAAFPGSVRINWRTHTQPALSSAPPTCSKASAICRDPGEPHAGAAGRTVLVGYTASGLNDAKPTPVGSGDAGRRGACRGHRSAVADSAIWMPPAWLKYALAAVLVLLTAFAFFRGEPASEIDEVFVATNLVLLLLAFVGPDRLRRVLRHLRRASASSACVSACAACTPACNADARSATAISARSSIPSRDRWLVMARLRFVPDPSRLDCRARSTAPARIPAPPAPLPVQRHRGGDAGRRRRTQELAVGDAGRRDGAGLERRPIAPPSPPPPTRTCWHCTSTWSGTTTSCPTTAACAWRA